ncbi:ABC transporter permease [Sporolactobacillus shoreicorticis]|uniref:ABC transporter permease n=1 Tax=Sporolactobacillus shoreicorticis TaxID=1923877 RepID=A0ABW5S3V9_9BACL|nr:ABC transporter permease [Sporolactobacillus shoreicorticis]MCO7124264.1 ABC transporter permease [Sporolactobacillus shoreicorticis]
MPEFIIKRVLQTLIVVFLALTGVFFLVRLSGDPTILFLPPDAPKDQIAEYRHTLGFDRPLYVQYADYIIHVVQGDFGDSLVTKESALGRILSSFPATLQLALSAFVVSLVIAIPIGVLSAYKRNTWFDKFGVGLTVLGQAIPSFWLGLLFIYFFAVKLHWFPTGGRSASLSMILPTATLAIYSLARLVRFTRSKMLDVLKKDYIRTMKAVGVSTLEILTKYALKNALLPIITLIALDLGALLEGAVITEIVFSWPGIGMQVMNALMSRDFPVVMAGIFVISLIYSVINFAADLLYSVVDPQIRLK